jgi:mRNA interferase RelE/StbE
MSRWKIVFHRKAAKELEKLDHQTKIFIIQSLEIFQDAYDELYERQMIERGNIRPLKGAWEGFYRLRLRNYRVIYEKWGDRLVIHIVRIAHRREVY